MPRPPLPPPKGEKADADALWRFMEFTFKPDTPYRTGTRRILNRARLYRAGNQWLEPLMGDDGLLSADWETLKQDDLNGIPMPVQNELFPLVTREAAMLVGVGTRPYVRPNKDDPKTERAAKFAKDVLVSSLEEAAWPDKERMGTTHLVTYGTWFLASYMDYDQTKTVRVPITTALRCPQCDVRFASPDLPPEDGSRISQTSPDAVSVSMGESSGGDPLNPEYDYTAKACPKCSMHEEQVNLPQEMPGQPGSGTISMQMPGAPPLVPYIPSKEEAQGGEDFLGRPLGEDLALGEAILETLSPFDVIANPACQGLDTTPDNWEEFAWATPRSLDWIRGRYKNGWKVRAENSTDIFKHHPVLGGLGSGGLTIGGPEMFQNHALVRWFVKKPYMVKVDAPDEDPTGGRDIDQGDVATKPNHGRLIMMANRVVLIDTTYEVESLNNPGTWIPRIHFDWAQWELRDRECNGMGMVEILFSQQDSINTNKSQQMDTRHRMANPKFHADDGVEFTYKGGAASGYTSDFLFYRRADPASQGEPKPFPGVTIADGVYREFELDLEAMPRIGMSADVDSGQPTGGVTAYSALLLLAQKSSEGRKPRNERIRDMKKRVFRHRLQLMHEFYREPRMFRARGKNDKLSVKEFKGLDLEGQVDVQFETEPVIDIGIARREAVQQGINLGTVVADTAAAKRRINTIMEIPNDINEDVNQQVDFAEREMIALMDDDRDPVIDRRGDDHVIHWQVHKEDLHRETWEDMKDLCDWRKILIALWGWEDAFDELMAAEQEFKVNPPIPPDPGLLKIPGSETEYTMGMQSYQRQMEMQAKIAALPKALELRILTVWMNLLTAAGFKPAPNSEAETAFAKVLRGEAHAEAHRRLAEEDAQKAAAGYSSPAAPGASQTDTGMIPTSSGQNQAPAGGGAGDGAVPSPGGPS